MKSKRIRRNKRVKRASGLFKCVSDKKLTYEDSGSGKNLWGKIVLLVS